MAIDPGTAMMVSAGISSLGSLFGKKKSKVKQKTETQSYNAVHPFLKEGLPELQNLYKQGGPEVYQGDRVAPINPMLQESMDYLGNYNKTANQLTDTAAGTAQEGLNGLGIGQGALQKFMGSTAPQARFDQGAFEAVANNPHLKGMMDQNADVVMQHLKENGLIQNSQGATAHGQYGSSRAGVADAILGREAVKAINQSNNELITNNYDRATQAGLGYGLNNAQLTQEGQRLNQGAAADLTRSGLSALQMAPQIQGMGFNTFKNNFGVGDYMQQYDQSKVNADMQQHGEVQQKPYANMDWYMGHLQGIGGMQSGGASSSTTGKPFDWMQANDIAQKGIRAYQDRGNSDSSAPTTPSSEPSTGSWWNSGWNSSI